MADWQSVFRALSDHGVAIDAGVAPRPVGGGDICAAWRVAAVDGPVFVKTAGGDSMEMFEAEAEGLAELKRADAVRVPEVLARGPAGGEAFLALEWIGFDRPGRDTERVFGEKLAAQHRCLARRFGWHRDNTIGLTPQHNDWSDDWVAFFREYRLGFQLRLAERRGFGGDLQREGAAVAAGIDRLFADYRPEPSLLHGDLWGGNWASCDGQPVIFDPAVHYGDRESDLAMSRLFGGFGPDFYRAYEESWPLAHGHERRLDLYQLYHVLNHLNLFGRSYLGRALSLIRRLNG